MLNEQEAQVLMETLVTLRNNVKENDKQSLVAYKKQEALCVNKFGYIVHTKTSRYKNFSNYEDLNQEGYDALIRGMRNYDPQKGSAFWWFHKYVDTTISRRANTHTTIRYPLKVAKLNIPHKENKIPESSSEHCQPDNLYENAELENQLRQHLSKLPTEYKEILDMAYGLCSNEQVSIQKICQEKNISRTECLKKLKAATSILKDSFFK
jgi:RNA polymerase sigma factor (sigma-70 family)